MTFRSHLGTSLSPGREPVRVFLALLSSPPSTPRRRLGNPAVPLMPSLRAMREQSRRVGKTRFRPREPARDSQTHSWVRSWRSVPELQLLELLLLSLLLQSIGLVVNLPARGVDSYLMTSPLIGRGPRAWPGRRGAPFPSSLGPSAPSFPGFRPFRVPQLAPRGQSGSGFPGFRPFHLSQLAPTCGPAAVLRRASLHDEDVQLRSQTPRLAPPRARIAHRSGSGSRHSAE